MTLSVDDPDFRLYVGDVRTVLAGMPTASVDCVVTSPPYWGLRDYGTASWDGGNPDCVHAPIEGRGVQTDPKKGLSQVPGSPARGGNPNLCRHCGASRVDAQIGLEATPGEYVEAIVAVFREVRRVLAARGTVWLNLGDSYVSSSTYSTTQTLHTEHGWKQDTDRRPNVQAAPAGLAAKNLVGIPWRVAFALQDDGWILRSDIIWAKPNPMPESVTDRPTKSHEYVFLLAKQPRYYFDQEAVREPAEWNRWGTQTNGKYEGSSSGAGWISTKTREELNAKRSSITSGGTGGTTLDGHTKKSDAGLPGGTLRAGT